ncbi:MAG: hypothetical protein HOW73_09125 [Polyangiaceae bacterium]|nr:hypothetical protein [Polyangiaceae bacterium]
MQLRMVAGSCPWGLVMAGVLVFGGCADDTTGTGGAGGMGGQEDGGATSALESEYPLTGDDLFPEGVVFDEERQAFFVGSLAHGNVMRVTAAGEQSVFYEGDPGAERATLGLQIDPERRRLWVCAIERENYAGSIWVFSLDSGERTHSIELEGLFAGASCNDITLDAAGRAYITDRENPNIYLVDLDTSEQRIWATHPLLEAVVGLNGIEIVPDGSAVLANTYLPARLVRISMDDPNDVTEVQLTGQPFQGTGALAGADGSAFLSDKLYVAFPNEVMEVVPADGTWNAATVRTAVAGPGLTAVTAAGGALYGSNGQSVTFVQGQEASPFFIRRTDLAAFQP